MDARITCPACGVTFHPQKEQLDYAQKLSAAEEHLARSEERVKDLETKVKDLNKFGQDNDALRAVVQKLATQGAPTLYHIELRTVSITQIFDQGFYNYYLDNHGNKILNARSIYLSTYSKDGTLLTEREVKCNDDLLYLMERNNITDIELIASV
jgi:hypothetical protein